MAKIGIIRPFKSRYQLETEKAVKVMLEWEETNWLYVREREEKSLSQEEIEWLREGIKD